MKLMKMSSLMLAAALVLSAGASTSVAQEGTKVDLTNVKCFIMPAKDTKEANAVDYKDAKVYFCCPGCVKKFTKDPDSFATKANHQLVLTKQFTQKACPISGGEVDPEQSLDIGGVKVSFCCGNCKKKVEDAKDLDAKAALVFSAEAFEKSFEKKKGDGK